MSDTGVSTIDNLAKLEALLGQGKVDEKDKDFATSLVEQAKRRGLSQKQWYWVGRIIAKVSGGAPVRVVGDFSGVYALFQRAATLGKLKYPKVRLQTERGIQLQLHLSGERSKVPGVVNVNDVRQPGQAWQDCRWYGRVDRDGSWQPNSRVPEVALAPVQALLTRLAKDPTGVASEYGRLTGLCCFCYRRLADNRSVGVGYGPQCADRYGLAWGSFKGDALKAVVDSMGDPRRVKVKRAA